MAQFARPIGDMGTVASATTGWTSNTGATTNLYTYIDETVASSADYVLCAAGFATRLEQRLSGVTDPVSSTGHIARIQMWALNAGGPAEKATVQLHQGNNWLTRTTIATVQNNITIARTATTYTYTLTAAEANAITDYSNLFVTASADQIGAAENFVVGWIEFEVPDAPAARKYYLIT